MNTILCKQWLKGNRKCSRQNRTLCLMTSCMVRSVHEIARYTIIHIIYNVLISGKLTVSYGLLVLEVPDI
jgi:hypothetical protein